MFIALRMPLSLVLLLLVNAASAEEQTVTLTEFDDTRSGFGFAAKKMIEVKKGDPVTTKIDLILDLPNGLASNNSKLTKELQGKGGIVDVGKKPLSEVKRAPESGYKPALKPEELVEGHSYCVLAADGEHYAKFHIKRLDEKKRLLEITWQYQAKMMKEFD